MPFVLSTLEKFKGVIDRCIALLLSKIFRMESVQKFLTKLAFSAENKKFSKYDGFGIHRKFPENQVDTKTLHALLNEAAKERLDWEGGKMSGAIYDGSVDHLKELSEFFARAIDADPLNAALCINSKDLVVRAFEGQQVANPLHGVAFSLSVKAIRELGVMLSSLVEGRFAVPNSGARESVRIALRALKRQKAMRVVRSRHPEGSREIPLLHSTPSARQAILVMDDNFQFIENIAKTLNLKTIHSTSEALLNSRRSLDCPQNDGVRFQFMVFNLGQNNRNSLESATKFAEEQALSLHIHIKNEMFQNLLNGHHLFLNRIFTLSPAISSVSFDTTGFIYNGISASIFKDGALFSEAPEAHVHWLGGVYPGLNSAGSLAGVDYILAYLVLLQTGKAGLRAKEGGGHPCRDEEMDHRVVPYNERKCGNFARQCAQEFHSQKPNVKSIHELLKQAASGLSEVKWRDELEQIFVDVMLSIFNASPDSFTGRMTSGGTESIRMALQLYIDRFRNAHQSATPVFLMTKSAHIAFMRHLLDTDAQIIYVETTPSETMDLNDLKAKIGELLQGGCHLEPGSREISLRQSKTPAVAAIIASAPSYPFGAADPIQDIAKIANAYSIPLHVDGCLGAFIMQFIEENPLRIDFKNSVWDGVTTWSADPHKYLTTQKGISFLGTRRNFLQNSSMETLCAPRSASTLEVGLTCVLNIGIEGYQRRAKAIAQLGSKMRSALAGMENIEVIANPEEVNIPSWVIAFRLLGGLRQHTYTLGGLMAKTGWHLSQVGDFALHVAITNAHTQQHDFLSKFLSDLNSATKFLSENPSLKKSASVGVYGMAAGLPNLKSGSKVTEVILQELTKSYARNLLSLP